MATFTVSAACTNVQTSLGLKVFVLTGAIESGGANAGMTVAPPNTTLTPNFSNSLIVEGLFLGGATFLFTAEPSNTFVDNLFTTASTTADGSYTGTVTAGTPVTVGASAPTANKTTLAAYEVLPSGGTPLIDASTPAFVHVVSTSPVTTASFTPPAGAVLAAVVPNSPAAAVTPSITDTSGLGLVWTQQAQFQNTTNSSSVAIFTTTVPGGGTPANVTGVAAAVTVAGGAGVPASDSAPGYAATATDLGAGSGSWASPVNAENAPDGTVATWTAP